MRMLDAPPHLDAGSAGYQDVLVLLYPHAIARQIHPHATPSDGEINALRVLLLKTYQMLKVAFVTAGWVEASRP